MAAEPRPQVSQLHGVTRLVFPLVGDLAGLGLPDPRSRNFDLAQIRVEGVADPLDLAKRIETIALGNWSAIGERFCAREVVAAKTSTPRIGRPIIVTRLAFLMDLAVRRIPLAIANVFLTVPPWSVGWARYGSIQSAAPILRTSKEIPTHSWTLSYDAA